MTNTNDGIQVHAVLPWLFIGAFTFLWASIVLSNFGHFLFTERNYVKPKDELRSDRTVFTNPILLKRAERT